MSDVLDTSDPVLLKVDRGLREEYQLKWNTYAGSPSKAAFDRAWACDQRFHKACRVAAADLKRENEQARERVQAAATSGSGKAKAR